MSTIVRTDGSALAPSVTNGDHEACDARVADVAVVIPAHNASRTIDAALASVAGQTIQPHQVIVVDDDSSDDTAVRATRWRSVLPLEVVSVAVRGAGRARHEGVRRARASVLAFLDADDAWLPDHLEVCTRLLTETPGVVGAKGIRWRPAATAATRLMEPRVHDVPVERQLDWIIRFHRFGTHVVLERALYHELGGFDPASEGVEDWDLWIRAVRRGVPLRRTDSPTFLYRQHAGNQSRDVVRVGGAALAMLERLENDILTTPEREDVADALRESRARVWLNIAYARLDRGQLRLARRAALRTLRGPWPVALRGAFFSLAPATSARLRSLRTGSATSGRPQ
jgi:glycosyltransferase involved in cell wall biosynthesis